MTWLGALRKPRRYRNTVPRKSTSPDRATPAARLIRLRWVAIAAVVMTTGVSQGLGILDTPGPIYLLAVALVVANAAFSRAIRSKDAGSRGLVVQFLVDLMALTGMLHFAGGVGNPLVILYVIHAILAAILLPRRQSFIVAGASCVFCKAMALGELFGLLSHHPLHLAAGIPNLTLLLARDPAYIALIAPLCLVVMLTAVFFVSGMMESLRAREATVRRVRVRLQAVLDSIRDGIVLFDAAGRPIACNRSTRCGDCVVSGADHDEVACAACPRWPYADRSPGSLREAIRGSGTIWSNERESGGRLFRHRFFPVDSLGVDGGMVWVVEDVTERRRLEMMARHKDRMTTAGLLAAGVAHEIRNPLASISAVLEDLQHDASEEPVREDLAMVTSHVYRISRILGALGNFTSRRREKRAETDLNSAVREALSIVRFDPRWRAIALDEHLDEGLPAVIADHDQLVQVFVNLALNAIEAMPTGGTLRVASQADAKDVRIEFRDTGRGMAAAVLGSIFNPFFTTKTRGDGAGLGLSVSDRIIHTHGGDIAVESEEDRGSVFTVRLPRTPSAMLQAESPTMSSQSYGPPRE